MLKYIYIYIYVYERFMKEFGIKHTQYAILTQKHSKENSLVNYKCSITKNLQKLSLSWRSHFSSFGMYRNYVVCIVLSTFKNIVF